ncbi:hypothetical protein BDB01DRAFT_539941 [Pilobolus umbonatus]|nr:hypothetical protein BDB01DRAFT_539941 [Pilobolus umbonatus]
MSTPDWFYIRSITTGNVIACPDSNDSLRAQAKVIPPTLSDLELWQWNGQFLRNKETGLVLDIRKGRLRVIEDTEICLYHEKPLEDAHNQLWGVKGNAVNDYGQTIPGSYIYSLCNTQWVLDIQTTEEGQKLVLFPKQPVDNDNQRWLFVPEGDLDLSVPITEILHKEQIGSYFSSDYITPPSSAAASPSYSGNETNYPRGLSPAKRGSHPTIFSIEAFKDSHDRIYSTRENAVSDKAIAMASAYEIFQNWKLNQMSESIHFSSSSELRGYLQSLAQSEVNKLLSDNELYPSGHVDTIALLSGRLIVQLYDQTPVSP